MSPEAFPKGFHVRKTIAFALVLTLLLPIAAFWGWLVLSPKPVSYTHLTLPTTERV